jgi:hypothetical protein
MDNVDRLRVIELVPKPIAGHDEEQILLTKMRGHHFWICYQTFGLHVEVSNGPA